MIKLTKRQKDYLYLILSNLDFYNLSKNTSWSILCSRSTIESLEKKGIFTRIINHESKDYRAHKAVLTEYGLEVLNELRKIYNPAQELRDLNKMNEALE